MRSWLMEFNYERKTPDLGRVRGSFRWVLWGSKFNGTCKQRSASKCIRPPPAWGPRSVYFRHPYGLLYADI